MDRRDVVRALGLGGAALATGMARAVMAEGAVQDSRPIVSRVALMDGRVVMALTIQGGGPYLFMLDTGAVVSIIDDVLAKSLKLDQPRSLVASGVGGRVTMPLYLARDVVFGGGARQRGVAFAGRDGGFGPDIRGALAAGMLTGGDSDLDIEKGEWRTYPGGRPDRTGFFRIGDAIKTDVTGSSQLFGDATINGRRFRFLLDTGAPGGFSINRRSARDLDLWNDTRPYAPVRPSGIGGQDNLARLVRSDVVEFGGVRFERPLVMVRDGTTRDGVDGIIGLSVLRQFNLSTEVKARALWVQRHASPEPLRDRYGLSGLWLSSERDRVTIADVGTGSPAAKAGLKIGDRITGAPFPALLRMLSGPPGTEISLQIDRGGTPATVRVALAPYL